VPADTGHGPAYRLGDGGVGVLSGLVHH
jgi:hypothetical protein